MFVVGSFHEITYVKSGVHSSFEINKKDEDIVQNIHIRRKKEGNISI